MKQRGQPLLQRLCFPSSPCQAAFPETGLFSSAFSSLSPPWIPLYWWVCLHWHPPWAVGDPLGAWRMPQCGINGSGSVGVAHCALAEDHSPREVPGVLSGRSCSPACVGGSGHVCVATSVIAGLPPACLGLPGLWPGSRGEVVYIYFKCVGSRSTSSEACPINVRPGTVDIAGCWHSDPVPSL